MTDALSQAETKLSTNGYSFEIIGSTAVVGDIHIGIKSDSSEFHESHEELFEWFEKEFLALGVKTVIFLGDVFHNRNEINVKSLSLGQRLVKKLAELFVVYLVLGNHDLYYKNTLNVSSLNIFQGYRNLHVISEPTVVNLNGRYALMCPWIIKIDNVIPELKKLNKQFDWIFGHFEFTGGQMTQTYKNVSHGYSTQTITQFLTPTGTVVSGHYHLKRYMDRDVFYIGSPLQLTWGDCEEEKSVAVIDENHNMTLIHNEITPKFVKINLSDIPRTPRGDQAPGNKKKFDIENNYIKLFIDKSISEIAMRKIIEVLNSKNPRSVAVVDLTVVSSANINSDELEKIKDPVLLIKEYLSDLELECEYDKELLVAKVDAIYREAITS